MKERSGRRVVAHEDQGHFALWIGGPWPPSADKRIAQTRRGLRYRTADYREFLALVKSYGALSTSWRFGRTWLTCDLHYVRPDQRRRDAHNTIKAILDALQEAGVFEDDLRVNPRIESVRDLGDPPSHPLVPWDAGRCTEPGVLVLLFPAAPASCPYDPGGVPPSANSSGPRSQAGSALPGPALGLPARGAGAGPERR